VENSANNFQKKIISGFKENNFDFDVLSAPFIGAFPVNYKKIFFKGFKNSNSEHDYIKFNNIWGFRNISRARNLKKKIKSIIKTSQEDKAIIIYSPHTPFLEAAVFAKKKDPKIKISMIVPDLPQYMNLNDKKSIIYRIGKKYDIYKFYKLNKFVDSYVILTEAMKGILNINKKPCLVVEGVIDEAESFEIHNVEKLREQGCRYVVYTGKVNYKFGLKELVDSFVSIKDESLRLVLCGNGDAVDYIKNKAEGDSRILYQGQVSSSKAKAWIVNADILVNPRQNNEAFIKYSFPSKNLEYLSSGKPVIGYMLDGMKPEYKGFMYIPEDNDIDSLCKTIIHCLMDKEENKQKKHKLFLKYRKKLESVKITSDIITMIKNNKDNA